MLLFRSEEVTPGCLQLRSAVIQKALKAASEFCSKVKTVESFVLPSEIVCPPQAEALPGNSPPGGVSGARHTSMSLSEYTWHKTQSHIRPTSELSLIPLSEIATAIVEGKSSVLTEHGRPLQLDTLLCFEPYTCIGRYNLCKLFDEDRPEHVAKVPITFLEMIPYQDRCRIMELLNPSQPDFQAATEREVGDLAAKVNETFRKWRNSSDGTFHSLRIRLDKFSVFSSRSILVSLYAYNGCLIAYALKFCERDSITASEKALNTQAPCPL